MPHLHPPYMGSQSLVAAQNTVLNGVTPLDQCAFIVPPSDLYEVWD